jgi:hypothetical protein
MKGNLRLFDFGLSQPFADRKFHQEELLFLLFSCFLQAHQFSFNYCLILKVKARLFFLIQLKIIELSLFLNIVL